MTFLEFTFSSGWHFVGMLFLLGCCFHGIARIIRAFWGKE